MKVSVVGSGYVGTTTSALLAVAGHEVTAVDLDEDKVKTINSGKSHFFEAGLDELIAHAVDIGKLTASTSYDSLKEADIVFSCVGTPDNPDGSPNLSYIDAVAETAAEYAQKGTIFIQKSTVPVGTGERLHDIIPDLIYVSNPEFLREGSAINDSILPDRLVIGCDDSDAAQMVADLFQSIADVSEEINRIGEIGIDSAQLSVHEYETFLTSVNSAELIKVTANAFLALKISFANATAKLADRSGADVVEVMNGVGSDKRIGRAFLNAGRGYGGGCFPKDVSGLISVAIDHGVDFSIMTSANELNESMPGYIVHKLMEQTDVSDAKVAVLGLAFKPGTSDARKSPAVSIANILAKEGAQVIGYDPEANEEATEELNPKVKLAESANEAVKGADIVLVATIWQEFRDLDLDDLAERMAGKTFVDCMNAFNPDDATSAGLTYIGVGR